MSDDAFKLAQERLEVAQARILEIVTTKGDEDATWSSDELTAALDELRDAKVLYDAVCEKLAREKWRTQSNGKRIEST